jgi:hypothetical protein
MTLGGLAEREMVLGNRVQPAGLLRTLRRQLIREVQRAGVIGNVKDAAATQCRELRKRVYGAQDADDPLTARIGRTPRSSCGWADSISRTASPSARTPTRR